MILVDAGPLVAAGFRDDAYHKACRDFLEDPGDELVVPALVVAEVCHLLASRAGDAVEAAFLRLFAVGKLVSVNPTADDYGRMVELVEQYGNLPLGGADAAVVAIAERPWDHDAGDPRPQALHDRASQAHRDFRAGT